MNNSLLLRFSFLILCLSMSGLCAAFILRLQHSGNGVPAYYAAFGLLGLFLLYLGSEVLKKKHEAGNHAIYMQGIFIMAGMIFFALYLLVPGG